MNKEMLQIKVYTHDGYVLVEQDGGTDGADRIMILPEQVELLCAWLEIAKEEIEQAAGGK